MQYYRGVDTAVVSCHKSDSRKTHFYHQSSQFMKELGVKEIGWEGYSHLNISISFTSSFYLLKHLLSINLSTSGKFCAVFMGGECKPTPPYFACVLTSLSPVLPELASPEGTRLPAPPPPATLSS